MASLTPAVVQNENLHIHTGKSVVGVKNDVPKSEQKGQQVRKALADISKARNSSRSSAAKASTLKDKSVPRGDENLKSTLKTFGLSEAEARKCNEWAKEGIEHVHFSGNDAHALQKSIAEECVKKKVEKVMSALREWTRVSYSLETPKKDIEEDSEDFTKLKLEQEVLPLTNASLQSSGNEDIEDPFFGEGNHVWPFPDYMFELKLKEEYHDNIAFF